jgi:hypothetical protein
LGQRFLGARFVLELETERIPKIDVFEPELFPVGDPERFGEFAGLLDNLFGFHVLSCDASVVRGSGVLRAGAPGSV